MWTVEKDLQDFALPGGDANCDEDPMVGGLKKFTTPVAFPAYHLNGCLLAWRSAPTYGKIRIWRRRSIDTLRRLRHLPPLPQLCCAFEIRRPLATRPCNHLTIIRRYHSSNARKLKITLICSFVWKPQIHRPDCHLQGENPKWLIACMYMLQYSKLHTHLCSSLPSSSPPTTLQSCTMRGWPSWMQEC